MRRAKLNLVAALRELLQVLAGMQRGERPEPEQVARLANELPELCERAMGGRLVRIEEAAERLGCGVSTLREGVQNRTVPHYRVTGGGRLFGSDGEIGAGVLRFDMDELLEHFRRGPRDT